MMLTMSEIIERALDGLELEDIDAVEAADKYLYISEDGGVVKFRSGASAIHDQANFVLI